MAAPTAFLPPAASAAVLALVVHVRAAAHRHPRPSKSDLHLKSEAANPETLALIPKLAGGRREGGQK